jgi:ketosteroid isomerase-like protein
VGCELREGFGLTAGTASMSTAAQSNAELIASYLDAVIRKDAGAVDRYFDRSVEYMVNGTLAPDAAGVLPPITADCQEALPWLGMHRGRNEVKKFLAHMHRNLEVTAFGPREVISQGSKGAAFGWFRLRSLSTGKSADIGYSIFFELRDGLIRKYHFFENTFDVARTFYAGGSWLIDTDGARHKIPPSEIKGELAICRRVQFDQLHIQSK